MQVNFAVLYYQMTFNIYNEIDSLTGVVFFLSEIYAKSLQLRFLRRGERRWNPLKVRSDTSVRTLCTSSDKHDTILPQPTAGR